MYDDYSIEALISAIKSQEVIWNTKLKDFTNMKKKRNAWKIVCTKVIDNFNEKNGMLKNVIAQVLKKEWKILKYGYFRYSNIEPKNDIAEKHYIYRQQLSFLSKIMQKSRHRPCARKRLSSAENFTDIYQENQRTCEETEGLSKRLRPELPNCAEHQDRMFLLSLVGDFSKIDDEYKLDARSEIIKIIKYYREMPHPSYEREFKNNNSFYPSSRSEERGHQSPILVDDLSTHSDSPYRRSPSVKRE